MTSQSLKNHPTTAPLKATRSETRSLWKRFLTGALCLCIAGSIPANDREIGKPLERLKQRSARQRWRELRGDWFPGRDEAPQAPQGQPPPGELPPHESAPLSTPLRTPARPIPVLAPAPESTDETVRPQSSTAIQVPAPVEIAPEAEGQASTRPSAKPPVDPEVPQQHPGSFGEVSLETRVGTPRERDEIPLPHWPFQDDLDLVGQPPFHEPSDVTDASRSAFPLASPPVVATPPSRPASHPELPKLTFPVRVAEVPATDASTPAASTESIPPAPPLDDALATQKEASESDTNPAQQLKSIHEIQPFDDYAPNGVDPQQRQRVSPDETPLVEQGALDRNHSMIPVYWQASNVYHNPLYFEDPGLERTGHTFSDVVQPFVSVGRFGAQFVALPYAIALDPVCKRESPLGHYRPGECAPKRHLAVPINGGAAATAAAAYTGIIFLIP